MYKRNGVVDLSHQSIKREVNLIESFMFDNEPETTSFSHKKK